MATRSANGYVKIQAIFSDKNVSVGLNSIAGKMHRLSGVFRRAGMVATAAFAAISVAVYAAVKAIMKFVNAYVAWGKQNLAITRLTGIAGKSVARLNVQLRMSGVDAAKAQTGLGLFAKKLDAARQGAAAAMDPFKRMGVALRDGDGNLRSAGDVLADVRDKLSTVKDAATRAGLAGALFGKGFQTMLPWLMKSREEIAKYNRILKESGVEWGGKQVRGMKDYIAAQREMQLRWDLFKVFLGQRLLPVVTRVFKSINKWLGDKENIKKVQNALEGVADTVSSLVGWFLKLSDGWKKFVGLVVVAGAASGPLMLALSGVLKVASRIAATIPALATSAAGAAGAGSGAAAGGAGLAASAAGAIIPVAVVAIAAGAGYVLGKALQRNEAARGGKSPGNTFGTLNRAPAGSKAILDTQPAQASLAALEKKWARLRERLALRLAMGELDNEAILDKLRATEKKMDALRNAVKYPFAMGHLKGEKWMSPVEKAQAKVKYFRSLVALPLAVGHLDTSGMIDPLQRVLDYFKTVKWTLENTPIASHVVTTYSSVGRPPRRALGGVVSRPELALVGEAGPEAIIPLTRPARAAQVMRQAGLTGGGDQFVFNIYGVEGGQDAGEQAAEAFIRRRRQLAMGY